MGRNSDLPPRKRGQIKVLLENTELTQCQIVLKCGVAQSVMSSIKKNMQHGSTGTPQCKGRCERKRISWQQADRTLVRLSKTNRKMTSHRLMLEMNTSGGQMSSRTVRRRLIEASLRAYRPRKKPKLEPANSKKKLAMMKKRVSWAKQFATWTEEDWKRVSCANVLITYCRSNQNI